MLIRLLWLPISWQNNYKLRGCPQSPVCHPERSEGSPEIRYWQEILRYAQKDNKKGKDFLDNPLKGINYAIDGEDHFFATVWNISFPKQRTTNTIEDTLPDGWGEDDC